MSDLMGLIRSITDTNASVISLTSLLIALCTFGLTLYHFYVIRKHNRITVRPYLTTRLDKNWDWDNNTLVVEWMLSNDGIGPAIIASYELRLDGETVDLRG